MPYDVRVERNDYVKDTLLGKEEIVRLLSGLKVGQVAVVFDTGGFFDFADLMKYYSKESKSGDKKCAMLSQGKEGGLEFGSLKHGALTWAVLNAISAGRKTVPNNERYHLSMQSLYDQVNTIFAKDMVQGKLLSTMSKPLLDVCPVGNPTEVMFADLSGNTTPSPSSQK